MNYRGEAALYCPNPTLLDTLGSKIILAQVPKAFGKSKRSLPACQCRLEGHTRPEVAQPLYDATTIKEQRRDLLGRRKRGLVSIFNCPSSTRRTLGLAAWSTSWLSATAWARPARTSLRPFSASGRRRTWRRGWHTGARRQLRRRRLKQEQDEAGWGQVSTGLGSLLEEGDDITRLKAWVWKT